MRGIFGGVLALMMSVSLSVSAAAQTDVGYRERLDLAREISSEMMTLEMHIVSVETTIPLLRQSYETIPGVSSRQIQAALELTEDILIGIYPETIEANAEVYASRFTLDELKEMQDFNRSDLGRKITSEMPSMMAEMTLRSEEIGRVAVEEQMTRFRAIFTKTS